MFTLYADTDRVAVSFTFVIQCKSLKCNIFNDFFFSRFFVHSLNSNSICLLLLFEYLLVWQLFSSCFNNHNFIVVVFSCCLFCLSFAVFGIHEYNILTLLNLFKIYLMVVFIIRFFCQ